MQEPEVVIYFLSILSLAELTSIFLYSAWTLIISYSYSALTSINYRYQPYMELYREQHKNQPLKKNLCVPLPTPLQEYTATCLTGVSSPIWPRFFAACVYEITPTSSYLFFLLLRSIYLISPPGAETLSWQMTVRPCVCVTD